ncbi:hypothetical protein [Psychrobacter sp. LV10R520-6]|uniref:hypothetical protein n=1 Tax=Psychrobacter sp. LV10R520-6 TaxID=1415574 RepID=UPI0024CC9CF9|nr:hypothetical protein [Psychrobacter sp. LV10R520-6]SNT69874.1 hypothetical protein SAMN04488491_0993 [Psychrobacter sp. LV10R520-6]
MTNTKSHPIKVATKTAKKADPFAALKSGIMMVSIAGTMAGWLLLLNQETDSPSVNTAILSTAISENGEMAIAPTPIVDINQLRQVNEVASAPVEAISVVARTRSSQ